ncbi:HEAT repeat domain-containing protein [Spirillospora sp. NPDC048911]|uniref:HEAT repeat domain-containing protein n=1 Tax=Spirillospora sp. NPDC048911 TaxID=3364527 RepID=UPI00371BF66A
MPDVGTGQADRWTPAQRARVQAVLGRIARDETRPVTARTAAIASLGRLPGTLGELAALADHADGAVTEAAIEAMAYTDEPAEAMPILLTHGRGPASKVAVAAMARCGEAARPSVLGPLLAEVLSAPDSKVTVRKQAARQLERHRTEGAADVLLRAWGDPELHPDVRVAVAVALRRMPEDPRAFEALGDAAGPDAGELLLRTLYQAQPAEYGPAHRPRYASLVRSPLGASELAGVRFRAVRAFATWARWYEGGYSDILDAAGDPSAPAEAAELPVLLALLGAGEIGDEVLPVLDRLLAAGLDETARSRIDRITSALAARDAAGRRGLARRAAERLAAHPLHVPQAARISLALLGFPTGARDAPSPQELAGDLAALARLLQDRPAHAGRLAGGALLSRFGSHGMGRGAPPALLPAARRLTDEGHLVAGLLAVALVGRAGPEAGWGPEWRDLLETLRRSEHLEVRQEAWDVRAS